MARPHALVVLLASASASAEPIDLPDTRATITLDPAWSRVDRPGLVYAATRTRGETLAITRAQTPNTDAWRSKTRDAYVDRIQRGFVGYSKITREVTSIEGVPVVDFEATGAHGPIVVRMILFRTYALSLAIEGAKLATARAIAATFVPPRARPEGSP